MSDHIPEAGVPELLASVVNRRAPVIVTFDGGGKAVDTFGDLLYYADSVESLIELLGHLLVGWGEQVETLAEVQMPSGRYADVRLAPEGELQHVILLDVTDTALERRESLQASHELAVGEQRRRAQLERQLAHVDIEQVRRKSAHNAAEVLQLLSWDLFGRLDEIRGYAQVLNEKASKAGAQSQTVGSIQRAALHLEAMLAACLTGGPDPVWDITERGPASFTHWLAELRTQVGEAPHLPPVVFEAHAVANEVVFNREGVHRALLCLISGCLEIIGNGLTVSMAVRANRLVVDLRLMHEPMKDAGMVRQAWRELPEDPRFVAATELVQGMGGQVDRDDDAFALIVQIPHVVDTPAKRRHPDRQHLALLAIDAEDVCRRVHQHLTDLGLVVRVCDELSAVEASSYDEEVALIVLGGTFAGASGVGLSYRLHAYGASKPMVLLRATAAGMGPSAWVFDGRRTILSLSADDDALRAALEGALQT